MQNEAEALTREAQVRHEAFESIVLPSLKDTKLGHTKKANDVVSSSSTCGSQLLTSMAQRDRMLAPRIARTSG